MNGALKTKETVIGGRVEAGRSTSRKYQIGGEVGGGEKWRKPPKWERRDFTETGREEKEVGDNRRGVRSITGRKKGTAKYWTK